MFYKKNSTVNKFTNEQHDVQWGPFGPPKGNFILRHKIGMNSSFKWNLQKFRSLEGLIIDLQIHQKSVFLSYCFTGNFCYFCPK